MTSRSENETDPLERASASRSPKYRRCGKFGWSRSKYGSWYLDRWSSRHRVARAIEPKSSTPKRRVFSDWRAIPRVASASTASIKASLKRKVSVGRRGARKLKLSEASVAFHRASSVYGSCSESEADNEDAVDLFDSASSAKRNVLGRVREKKSASKRYAALPNDESVHDSTDFVKKKKKIDFELPRAKNK